MQLKRIFFLVPVIFLVTACSDNIDRVKGGTLDNYPSLTVGQALDNYKGCVPKSQKWKKFTTDNGMEIVEFSCHATDYMELSDRLVRKYANDETSSGLKKLDNVDLESATLEFQFSISKDSDRFQLEYSGYTLIWPDGKKYSSSNDNLYDYCYNNKSIFDEISKLPTNMQDIGYRQLDAESELMFSMLRAKSK